jgi:hypothetical protein
MGVLAFLVAADKPWYRNAPAPEWQWISFGVGLVALVLGLIALPTVFQMFGGAAKADIDFNIDPRFLSCSLSQPLVVRWLRWLKIRRPAVDVTVGFWIERVDTGETVASTPFAQLRDMNGNKGKQLILSASILPSLRCFILGHELQYEGRPFIVADDDKTRLELDTYEVKVIVIHSGVAIDTETCRFVLTANGIRAVDGNPA